MHIFQNIFKDPYFNLALEEYFFDHLDQDYFFLWRNEPSVIIGNHQKAEEAVDLEFARSKDIKIVRRLTGGAAVYHDLGNINFTFIQNSEDPKSIDKRRFMQPVIDILKKFEVAVELDGTTDMTIDSKKISGNAEYIHGNRILHHGSILYESDLQNLSKNLKVKPANYSGDQDNANKPVTNIVDHMPEKINIDQFLNLLQAEMTDHLNGVPYEIDQNEVKNINELADKKYRTDAWNFEKKAQKEYHLD